MTAIPDNWQMGDSYERYVGRWSRRVAPAFVSWLGVGAGRTWLDVGCGTGALCAAIVEGAAPSRVVAVEPSEGFLETAKASLQGRATLHRGSATAIPLEDASVDVVVSGLMLNFVEEPRAALTEMKRVCAGDGTIGAYVWDYAGRMDLMRIFWDAAVELDDAAAELDEGRRFPLCAPDALAELFAHGGLGDVDVCAIDVPTRFESFDDYWEPFLGGQGPAPAYVMSLDERARARLRERVREALPMVAGSIELVARAWAVRGVAGRTDAS
jgi:SAM-dependent methyltransferase